MKTTMKPSIRPTSNGGFRWARARAIADKEIAHITRDPFTIALALVLPMIVVLIFGIAIEFNLTSIPTSYLDSDLSQSSRSLTESFGSSDYFQMRQVRTAEEGLQSIEAEKSRALVIIPPRLERDIVSGHGGQGASVQVIVDGADNSSVSSVLGYLGEVQRRYVEKVTGRRIADTVQLKTRFLYNPELNSKWFIVPGLMAVIMSMMALLLTALTVAREWEHGSMELLLSTPVQPLEIILGKLAPYAGLGMGGVLLVYLMARLFFGVPFVGSHLVFIAGSLLFIITYLAQGLMISVVTRKQTIAMQVAMLSGLLPTQLLSGFIFPVESMPPFFQWLTKILPARWFVVISRDSFLQGSGFWDLREPFLALSAICLVFVTVAVRKFKKDVEP